MSLILLALVALISGAVGWVLGVASSHNKPKPAKEKQSAAIKTTTKREPGHSVGSSPVSKAFDTVESQTCDSPTVEASPGNFVSSPQTGEHEGVLKELIDSLQDDQALIKTRKRYDGRIRHLLVTRNGERWVVDQLPKDDYADVDSSPQSVDQLISKPVGYRLVKGYNLLREDDTDEGQDS